MRELLEGHMVRHHLLLLEGMATGQTVRNAGGREMCWLGGGTAELVAALYRWWLARTALPAISDRISYVEGVVEAINDDSHGRGYPAYRILVDRDVIQVRRGMVVLMPSLEGSPDLDPPSELLINRVGERLCPPVNGTRSLMSGRTFGVVALPDDPGAKDRSVA